MEATGLRLSSEGWLLVLLSALALACAPAAPPAADDGSQNAPTTETFVAEEQESHTSARLQAVSAVSSEIVWASGLEGTFTRTIDGGETWTTGQVPRAEELQFRDIHAVEADTAYLLAAGPGDLSRIFKTVDGGNNWRLLHLNPEADGFLGCFDFWSPERGIAYGDSVRGELYLLTTDDGTNWSRVPAEALPAAAPGEGGFAASGGCVETGSSGRAWIATGAGGAGRVLRTSDYGASWSFSETPVVRGDAAGLTAVLFRDDSSGLALGGDLEQNETVTPNVAVSGNGGITWRAGGLVSFPGAVYGGAWSHDRKTAVAAGPNGISLSFDGGIHWTHLSDRDIWSVAFGDADTFWAVGPEGRITRFSR